MGKTALAVCATFLLAACGSAQNGGTPYSKEVDGGSVRVWVEAESEILPIYEVDGQNYLLGIEGRYYQVGLLNKSDVRLEVLVSVDGLDVITGQVADYRKHRGYVLEPGEDIRVEGFRRSLDSVASFKFTSHQESYASRIGEPANVGVIGVAVFDEEPPPDNLVIAGGGAAPTDAPAASRPSTLAESSVDSEDKAAQSLGTEYGDNIDSQAEIVPFKRRSGDEPIDVIALFYNDRQGLEEAGVVFEENGPLTIQSADPDPFPGVDKSGGFAPPPTR